jgi:hypothetical protein
VAEFWAEGELIAYAPVDDGDLMLRIERRHGAPMVLGVRSLAQAPREGQPTPRPRSEA